MPPTDIAAEMAALQDRPGSDAPLRNDGAPSYPTPSQPPLAAPAAPAAPNAFNPAGFTPPAMPTIGAPGNVPGTPTPGAPGAPVPGTPVDPNAPPVDPNAARTPQTPEEVQQQRDNLRVALGETRAENKRIAREMAAQAEAMQRQAQNFQTLMAQMMGGRMPVAQPGQPPAGQPPVAQLGYGQPPAPGGFQPIDLRSIQDNPLAALEQIAQMANAMQAQQLQAQQQAQLTDQQRRQQHAQQQNQIRHVAAVAQAMEDHEEEFRAVAPDYDDAAGYYVESRMNELVALGYPEEQAYKAVEYEVIQAADTSLRNRANPAKALYDAAKARGFTGPRPTPVPPQPAPAPGYGQPGYQPAPAAPAPGVDPLAAIRAGQAASVSVGQPGGYAVGQEDSLAHGLSLTGAAFASWSEKFLRQQMGKG